MYCYQLAYVLVNNPPGGQPPTSCGCPPMPYGYSYPPGGQPVPYPYPHPPQAYCVSPPITPVAQPISSCSASGQPINPCPSPSPVAPWPIPVPPPQPVNPPRTCGTLPPEGECVLDLNPTIPSFSVTYKNMSPTSHATVTLQAAGTLPNLPITIPPGEVITQTYHCGNIYKIVFKNETSTASVEVHVNQ